MAFFKFVIVFLALVAASLAMPQFFGGRPFGGQFFNPGAQANAGGFTNSNNGFFGPQGSSGGFGSASGPHAAFATGSANGGMGMNQFGFPTGFQGQGSGTAFGF